MSALRFLHDPHIVVDRDEHELRLLRRSLRTRRLLIEKRYPIAVGMVGLRTPKGQYEILNRSRHPSYTYPLNSEWVEPEWRGKKLAFGDPRNPIAARWLGLTKGGIGIHGTFDEASIGSDASHGCIRMTGVDVRNLYGMAPKGTPVAIY